MNNLKAFLKGNAQPAQHSKVLVSKRFTDDAGNPIEWEVRQISGREYELLQNKHMKYNPDGTARIDVASLNIDSTVMAVVYPDLSDAKLQDSYGVMGEAELLKEMLTAAEFAHLQLEISKAFTTDTSELVETAKN